MKNNKSILEYKSKSDILSIIDFMRNQKITSTGHGFDAEVERTIGETVGISIDTYFDDAKVSPAITLIDVILAANRNYNKAVLPNIIRIKSDHPNLKTFDDLENILNSYSKDDFFKFWGHRDDKKYNTLLNIMNNIKLINFNGTPRDDFDLMNYRAKNVDLENLINDPIGSIPNVGIATIQHLRMNFGIFTIKPDQRVMEVLKNEFLITKLDQVTCILYIEEISKITGINPLELDQIFVKYGSSYYSKL